MADASSAELLQVCDALRDGAIQPYPKAAQDAEELRRHGEALRAGPAGSHVHQNPLRGLSVQAQRFFYEARLFLNDEFPGAGPPASRPAREDAQCELFALFGAVFGALTGYEHRSCTQGEAELNALVTERMGRAGTVSAVRAALSALALFYLRRGAELREHCAQLGGIKVLIDPGAGFERPVIRRIRCLGLYVDTHLLPDPFTDAAFAAHLEGWLPDGRLAVALRRMLQLEPLVEARLAVPPLMLFPNRQPHWRVLLPHMPEMTTSLKTRAVARVLGVSEAEPGAIERAIALAPHEYARGLFTSGLLPCNGFDPQTQLNLCMTALKMARRSVPQFAGRSAEAIMHVELTTTLHQQVLYYRQLRAYGAHPSACDGRSAQLQRLFNGLPNTPTPVGNCQTASIVIRTMQIDGLVGVTNASVPLLADLLRRQEHQRFRARLNDIAGELKAAQEVSQARAAQVFNHEVATLVADHEAAAIALQDATLRRAAPLLAGLTGSLIVGYVPELSAFMAPYLSSAPVVAAAGSGAGVLMAAGAHHWQRFAAQTLLGGVLARDEPEPCDL